MIFKKIFVNKKFKCHPAIKKLKSNFPKKIKFFSDLKSDLSFPQAILLSPKKIIVVTKQPGKFVNSCPGTINYICCGYKIIENATNCPFDCSYCYLQTYLNRPFIYYYLNDRKLFQELKKLLKKNPNKFFRIGTGEFADSLALDDFFNLSKKLILFFSKQKNAILELKTKSACVHHLLHLKHNQKTVIAWSLNTEKIIKEEEKGTASLEQRLQSALKVAKYGYPVAFHFDPLIYYHGWQKDYQKVIKKIYKYLTPEKIAWISLGTLRFTPAFQKIFKNRFPQKKLLLEEFITGTDGKLRYFKPIRVKMYRYILKNIRLYDKKTLIYLCMESPEVWNKIFNLNEKKIFTKSPFKKFFSFDLKSTPQPPQ